MSTIFDINEILKSRHCKSIHDKKTHVSPNRMSEKYFEWSPPYFLKLIYGDKIMIPYSKLISTQPFQPIKSWKDLFTHN